MVGRKALDCFGGPVCLVVCLAHGLAYGASNSEQPFQEGRDGGVQLLGPAAGLVNQGLDRSIERRTGFLGRLKG